MLRPLGSVIKRGVDVFTGQVGEVLEQFLNGVAVGEHSDDLMHGDARAADVGLAVEDVGIGGDSAHGWAPAARRILNRALCASGNLVAGHDHVMESLDCDTDSRSTDFASIVFEREGFEHLLGLLRRQYAGLA